MTLQACAAIHVPDEKRCWAVELEDPWYGLLRRTTHRYKVNSFAKLRSKLAAARSHTLQDPPSHTRRICRHFPLEIPLELGGLPTRVMLLNYVKTTCRTHGREQFNGCFQGVPHSVS
jgi:hypothetical protein